jgi:hypothetical protein
VSTFGDCIPIGGNGQLTPNDEVKREKMPAQYTEAVTRTTVEDVRGSFLFGGAPSSIGASAT